MLDTGILDSADRRRLLQLTLRESNSSRWLLRGIRSREHREMHPPSKRKAQLAVEGDSRMVRAKDMQERDFGPRCYR